MPSEANSCSLLGSLPSLFLPCGQCWSHPISSQLPGQQKLHPLPRQQPHPDYCAQREAQSLTSSGKSADQLNDGSNYLEYHLGMYVQTYVWLRSWQSSGLLPALFRISHRIQSWVFRNIYPGYPRGFRFLIANAVEQSHAVHARILIDFVNKESTTDVSASDYFPSRTTKPRYPLKDKTLRDLKQEVERSLLHMTTWNQKERMDQIKWPIRPIAVEIEREHRRFLTTVSPQQASCFADHRRTDCLRHLERLDAQLSSE